MYHFDINPISQTLASKILGCSWKEGSPPLKELSHITLSHIGFDEKIHQGEMIVHKNIAQEVIEIFQELLKENFPIEKIRLIEAYGGSDDLSMQDNNSYCFCFREAVAKPGILSKHSFGLAIDINPLYNPYVRGNLILPPEGKVYLDRSKQVKGMLSQESVCCKAFTNRGWVWGGIWEDRQDYHHFEVEAP